MKELILESGKELINKANQKKIQGFKMKLEDIKEIEEKIKTNLPSWYIELVTNLEIVNLKTMYHENESENEWKYYEMKIATKEDMIREATAYPGCNLIKYGYVCFGISRYGADNFYINTKNGDKVKIIQFFHDVDYEKIDDVNENQELISSSIVEYFKKAKIER